MQLLSIQNVTSTTCVPYKNPPGSPYRTALSPLAVFCCLQSPSSTLAMIRASAATFAVLTLACAQFLSSAAYVVPGEHRPLGFFQTGLNTNARAFCPCIRIYNPVCCGVAGKGPVTQGNECTCTQCEAGVVLYHDSCTSSSPPTTEDSSVLPPSVLPVDCPSLISTGACLMYNPVCCSEQGQGHRLTYPNACVCACQYHGTVLKEGPC